MFPQTTAQAKLIEGILNAKRAELAEGEHIATLIKHYEDKGKETGTSTLVAAFDDHLGNKAHSNNEKELLRERQILREILKKGTPDLATDETQLSAITYLKDNGCVPKMETHLEQVQLRGHKHRERVEETHTKLQQLRTNRPVKPHNHDHCDIARQSHSEAVHKHAHDEHAAHTELAQLMHGQEHHA